MEGNVADQEFESRSITPQLQAATTPEQASEAAPASVQREVIDKVSCRAGDASCASAHAAVINRATDARPGRANRALLQLQRRYGNHFVEQVLARAQESAGPNEVHPAVERTIEQQRGAGQPLDQTAQRQMESSLGADFSRVRVHTGDTADTLNRSLSARAFTTGNDIFFRQGAYQPGSFVGRELLAHELTHVVQQNGSQVSRAMSLSHPGDEHEKEAEHTAHAVMQKEMEPHTSRPGVAREAVQEDDPVMRQPEALKDDEEKKKHHHVATQLDAATVARADEEQPE
jgi:hypothetical protein